MEQSPNQCQFLIWQLLHGEVLLTCFEFFPFLVHVPPVIAHRYLLRNFASVGKGDGLSGKK